MIHAGVPFLGLRLEDGHVPTVGSCKFLCSSTRWPTQTGVAGLRVPRRLVVGASRSLGFNLGLFDITAICYGGSTSVSAPWAFGQAASFKSGWSLHYLAPWVV